MTIQEKRQELKALSQPLSILKKQGAIKSINEALKSIYSAQGHDTLKTLREWNNEGKRIKKGEHALLLWGRPKTKQVDETADEFSFYPICFVFSDKQIQEGAA